MMLAAILFALATALRFLGFAEPLAGMTAALIFSTAIGLPPFDVLSIAAATARGGLDSYLAICVVAGAVIAGLLAGCNPGIRRPRRPLGWFAPGDPAFVGTLLAVAAMFAGLLEISLGRLLAAVLPCGAVVLLATAGIGELLRAQRPADVRPSDERRAAGLGLLAIAAVGGPILLLVASGLATPTEAFVAAGVPAALGFRLIVSAFDDRGPVGLERDLLRGIADAAWVVMTLFAVSLAGRVIVSAGVPVTKDLPPLLIAILAAAAMLLLGFAAGSTFGTLLAGVLLFPTAQGAGIDFTALATIATLAATTAFARPSLGIGLLSWGRPRSRGGTPVEAVAAFAGGALVSVAAAVLAPDLVPRILRFLLLE